MSVYLRSPNSNFSVSSAYIHSISIHFSYIKTVDNLPHFNFLSPAIYFNCFSWAPSSVVLRATLPRSGYWGVRAVKFCRLWRHVDVMEGSVALIGGQSETGGPENKGQVLWVFTMEFSLTHYTWLHNTNKNLHSGYSLLPVCSHCHTLSFSHSPTIIHSHSFPSE